MAEQHAGNGKRLGVDRLTKQLGGGDDTGGLDPAQQRDEMAAALAFQVQHVFLGRDALARGVVGDPCGHARGGGDHEVLGVLDAVIT